MLSEKKEERGVKFIRGGVEKIVEVHQVVVGDIALLEPGEIIPCDGVFLPRSHAAASEARVEHPDTPCSLRRPDRTRLRPCRRSEVLLLAPGLSQLRSSSRADARRYSSSRSGGGEPS